MAEFDSKQQRTAAALPPGFIMRKTCACGRSKGPTGECAECRRKQVSVQTRLRVNTPGDRFEQEADSIAQRVMQDPAPALSEQPQQHLSNRPAAIQRQPGEEEEEEAFSEANLLSLKEIPGHSHDVTSSVAGEIDALDGGGQPLEAGVRSFMENRIGHHFGDVRVHTNGRAASTAQAINARAYTLGRNVVFGSGEYRPNSHSGRQLLAHELVHVIQQKGDGATVMRACDCSKGSGRRASASEDTFLRSKFPRLVTDDYCITRPKSKTYNCIAWSVGSTSQWIWNQVDSVYGDGDGTVSIADFDAFYDSTLTLAPAQHPSSNTVVALFGNGTTPTHAAATNTGDPNCGAIPFTSKLGSVWAISHDLYQLEGGSSYGNVIRYYDV